MDFRKHMVIGVALLVIAGIFHLVPTVILEGLLVPQRARMDSLEKAVRTINRTLVTEFGPDRVAWESNPQAGRLIDDRTVVIRNKAAAVSVFLRTARIYEHTRIMDVVFLLSAVAFFLGGWLTFQIRR